MYNEELHGSAILKTRNKENGDRRLRFERSAIYRDSRRKTAAMLKKKKNGIKGENSEDEGHSVISGEKKVQFVEQTSFLRSHRRKKRERMIAIEEDKAEESQMIYLSGSPYNKIIKENHLADLVRRSVNENKRRPLISKEGVTEQELSSICRRVYKDLAVQHLCCEECECSGSALNTQFNVPLYHSSVPRFPSLSSLPLLKESRIRSETKGKRHLGGLVEDKIIGRGISPFSLSNLEGEHTSEAAPTSSGISAAGGAPSSNNRNTMEKVPELGPLSDGLTLPETNASRDMKIFKRVLRDPNLRRPFQVFLEQQFCAENLNFYVAVEQFRDMQFNNESKVIERANYANRIYERHFAPNSMEPVNVDNSTSKRIRETMQEGKYPRNTFDLAQYQIFHLLKYDCWPRFLRAGGIQPEFSDEELAEEDERQHRLDLGEDLPDVLTLRSSMEGERQPSSSLSPSGADKKKLTDKDKRRSLLWHGFDRFSRKLRREPPRSTGGSPVAPRHQTVHRTSSSRAEEPRRSYSSEENDATSVPRVVGSAGSKRRHMFAAGKQYSMPAEISHPNSPSPLRHTPRVEPKHSRLMTGDSCNTEIVELNDPTISVRLWTQNMATALGMDKNATEAVDAETGSTIDPARQAIDALQSRAVRIVPVVTFAVEILPPNFSFKNPSSTPTKIIMVRARHSLSAGGVLRPLLSKYAIEYNTVTVVFCGTLDSIRNSVSIGNIGPRTLTVMSQAQYNDRLHGGKKDLPMPRDPIASSPNLAAEHNLQFHQHGDVSYCELPSEADRLKHAQKEHSLSLMKFVRKASAAVTSKDDSTRLGGQKTPNRRKSVGQSATAGVYCGEEASPEPPKEPIKKRLSLFKNKSKDCPHDRPSTSAERLPLPSRESPRVQARECYTQPVPPTVPVSKPPVSPRTSNGDTPRTPAIFSTKVCSEGEEAVSNERGWQAAAYV